MVNRGVRWQLTAAYTATTSAATILNTSRPRMDLTDELTFGRVPKFTFTTIHATVAPAWWKGRVISFLSPGIISIGLRTERKQLAFSPPILPYNFSIPRAYLIDKNTCKMLLVSVRKFFGGR